MARKPEARERGLYKNGRLWWLRSVPSPVTKATKPRSTDTADLALANRIARMVPELLENRTQHEWLELAHTGDLALGLLYNHKAAGTLHLLRQQREASAAADDNPLLSSWVDRWDAEHLATLDLAPKSRRDYLRQVRTLVTPTFRRSDFTEDTIKAWLLALRMTGLSSGTLRRHTAAVQLFYRYARKRVPLTVNPFEDADWIPSNGSPRSIAWDHDTRVKVLGLLTGESRVAMALVLGSGVELGALLAMTGAHISRDGSRTIVAPGTKNKSREQRTIFVDAWAWPTLQAHTSTTLPRAALFPTLGDGGSLRDRFYEAQVAAGLIAQPERSARTGKLLWGAVKPHTVHDARHTYVACRMLGLDGEPKQDAKFCSMQLGHATEQMVLQIYGKLNLRERLRLIELRDARNEVRIAK